MKRIRNIATMKTGKMKEMIFANGVFRPTTTTRFRIRPEPKDENQLKLTSERFGMRYHRRCHPPNPVPKPNPISKRGHPVNIYKTKNKVRLSKETANAMIQLVRKAGKIQEKKDQEKLKKDNQDKGNHDKGPGHQNLPRPPRRIREEVEERLDEDGNLIFVRVENGPSPYFESPIIPTPPNIFKQKKPKKKTSLAKVKAENFQEWLKLIKSKSPHDTRYLFKTLKPRVRKCSETESQSSSAPKQRRVMIKRKAKVNVPNRAKPNDFAKVNKHRPRSSSPIPISSPTSSESSEDEVKKMNVSQTLCSLDLYQCYKSQRNYIETISKQTVTTEERDDVVRKLTFQTLLKNFTSTSSKHLTTQSLNFSKADFNYFHPIAQVDKKFVLTSYEKDGNSYLCAFDPHAVEERLRLDLLMNITFNEDESVVSENLPNPIKLKLEEKNVIIISQNVEGFAKLGLTLEIVNEYTVKVLSVPVCFMEKLSESVKEGEGYEVLVKLIKSLIGENIGGMVTGKKTLTQATPKTILDVLASRACRGAIKFGENIAMSSMKKRIRMLQDSPTPFQCAHGRPSLSPIINLTGSNLPTYNDPAKRNYSNFETRRAAIMPIEDYEPNPYFN